jgi:hypothetical protein
MQEQVMQSQMQENSKSYFLCGEELCKWTSPLGQDMCEEVKQVNLLPGIV